ncbi:MAG: hypothetical protein FJW61_03260 [Actinobacteria bacterium]|nr:hypothetical protein [Actinomycetota bacterium]
MNYPCLKINLSKIANNCRIIYDRCASSGISVVGVSKSVLGDTRIAEVFKDSGIKVIGDSRLKNLKKLRDFFGHKQKLIMLRTPMISEIVQMLEVCYASMNTQKDTVKRISDVCSGRNFKHKIIIMVETDDKREGLLPEEVIPFCNFIKECCPGIEIWGLGTNARCISAKKPEPESMELLVNLRGRIKEELAIYIPVISGGNSSIWEYIENGIMPENVNQVRIGEAILLGHETSNYKNINGAHRDAFILESEIIEVKQKNGKVYKIITALGLQDVSYTNIYCTNPVLEIAGQSSDHTIMTVNKNLDFKIGDIIAFQLDYFGLLSCMTSPFINKIYL